MTLVRTEGSEAVELYILLNRLFITKYLEIKISAVERLT